MLHCLYKYKVKYKLIFSETFGSKICRSTALDLTENTLLSNCNTVSIRYMYLTNYMALFFHSISHNHLC